jgi:hypothetical protein
MLQHHLSDREEGANKYDCSRRLLYLASPLQSLTRFQPSQSNCKIDISSIHSAALLPAPGSSSGLFLAISILARRSTLSPCQPNLDSTSDYDLRSHHQSQGKQDRPNQPTRIPAYVTKTTIWDKDTFCVDVFTKSMSYARAITRIAILEEKAQGVAEKVTDFFCIGHDIELEDKPKAVAECAKKYLEEVKRIKRLQPDGDSAEEQSGDIEDDAEDEVSILPTLHYAAQR